MAKQNRQELNSPAFSTILTNRFCMGFSFGFAIGKQRDDEDKPEGTNSQEYPKKPSYTAPMLGLNLCNSLNPDILTSASWTNQIEPAFQSM